MNQHQYKTWFESGDGTLPQILLSDRHYRVRSDVLSQHLLEALPSRLADLLRISATVYILDRISRRNRRSRENGWWRPFDVTIEVSDVDFWGASQASAALTDCVNFLSGDQWQFRFVTSGLRRPVQRFLPFEGSTPRAICLYSGGLDSAAGLANRLREASCNDVLALTIRHQTRQRRLVHGQLHALQKRYGRNVISMCVPIAMSRKTCAGREEPTQRARAFLFTAFGAVVAALTDAPSVEMYESGVGAVNLPLMAGMMGSKATRSSHPRFLRLMEELVELVVERPITFHQPFLQKTKAEVVRALAEDNLDDVARSSVSCVHYPLRESKSKRCGYCPACIFRRQALITAGIREPDSTYKYDLFGDTDTVAGVPDARLINLKAFLNQAVRLAELETESVPAFVRNHLIGTRIVERGEAIGPFVDLLRRYHREWFDLIRTGQQMGWTWTGLVGQQFSMVA